MIAQFVNFYSVLKKNLDRYRNLIQFSNQPRTKAAEATDEDDEEAGASYHHTHPSGYGG